MNVYKIYITNILWFEGKNTAQTDEEKQRERQRNEREQKNAEVEAQHLKVRNCYMIYMGLQ